LQKKFKLLGLSLMILAVIILLYAWGFAMQTVDYYISSDKINDKLKIVFISDLHNCTYGGADQSGLLDEIHNADPDLVLFGGDVIDQYDDYDNALTLMSEVAKEYPACYTSGNHEHKRSDLEQFLRQVSEIMNINSAILNSSADKFLKPEFTVLKKVSRFSSLSGIKMSGFTVFLSQMNSSCWIHL